MEVILLERVANLGDLGETVKVRPGYARNYLLPQGRALLATERNRADFEARRVELERRQAARLDAARSRAERVAALALTITRAAGEQGKLFGSVTAQDIAEAITASGVEVRKQEVRLAQPIRQIGEYEVGVQLHGEVSVTLNVSVVAGS